MAPSWQPTARRLGRELRHLREERGWSQQQLAEASGVAQQNVSLYERGLSSPRLDTLSRLLDALGAELRVARRAAEGGGVPGLLDPTTPSMSLDELLAYVDRQVALSVERERRRHRSGGGSDAGG